ncbi:hypothetical protein [Crocosphaera sp. Alani8]|uniref:hypothetical protein n=1 Tax=Crocosphaera sp. Alani8 TaxID=3038952 RepID=UPI00313A9FFA
MSDFFGRLKIQFDSWYESLKTIKTADKFFAIFLLTVWVIILVSYFIPSNYIFQGNLIVESLSFTYNGNNDKLFLQNIQDINSIDFQGKLEQPIGLFGKFSIDNNPELENKLANIDTLTIELPFPESRFIVNQGNESKTTQISLNELRIEPETNINQLAYNHKNNSLDFCLHSIDHSSDDCQFPEDINETQSPITIGQLRLELGQKPLQIQLSQINIDELNIKSDRNNPQEIILQFTPNDNEPINLNLLSPNQLFITLPKPKDNNNSMNWFRRDIDVKNVQFSRYETTQIVTDEVEISTILQGEIRLGKNKMKLEKNQFLITNSPQSAIKKIRSLSLTSDPKLPQGIQTFITGETNSIAVGLYRDFPVESIQPNLLSKHLSSEAITAIITFITTLTAVFLPRLFPDSPDD